MQTRAGRARCSGGAGGKARAAESRIEKGAMRINLNGHLDLFHCETLADAVFIARCANSRIFAKIGERIIGAYPGGRCEDWTKSIQLKLERWNKESDNDRR